MLLVNSERPVMLAVNTKGPLMLAVRQKKKSHAIVERKACKLVGQEGTSMPGGRLKWAMRRISEISA